MAGSPDWEPSGLGTGSPDPGGRAAGFKYSGSTAAAGSVLVWFAAGVCSAAPLPSTGWDSPGTAEEIGFSQTHHTHKQPYNLPTIISTHLSLEQTRWQEWALVPRGQTGLMVQEQHHLPWCLLDSGHPRNGLCFQLLSWRTR